MGSITSTLVAFTNPIIGKENKHTFLPLVTWGARLEGGRESGGCSSKASINRPSRECKQRQPCAAVERSGAEQSDDQLHYSGGRWVRPHLNQSVQTVVRASEYLAPDSIKGGKKRGALIIAAGCWIKSGFQITEFRGELSRPWYCIWRTCVERLHPNLSEEKVQMLLVVS